MEKYDPEEGGASEAVEGGAVAAMSSQVPLQQPVQGLAVTPEPPAPADVDESRLPWYRRRWVRVLLTRLAIRAGMIGLLVGLSFVFSVKSVVRKYAAWIHGYEPTAASVALFTAIATVFASIAPGSSRVAVCFPRLDGNSRRSFPCPQGLLH